MILFYNVMKISVRKIKNLHSSCMEENGLENRFQSAPLATDTETLTEMTSLRFSFKLPKHNCKWKSKEERKKVCIKAISGWEHSPLKTVFFLMLGLVVILSRSVNDSLHINGLLQLTTNHFNSSFPTITINQPSALSSFIYHSLMHKL